LIADKESLGLITEAGYITNIIDRLAFAVLGVGG
jgi:hypothetical protein